MDQMDPEVRRKRLETGLKWGGGLLGVIGLGFLAPLIISGVVGGTVALIGAGVGYVAIQWWPVFARKVANQKFKMIATEARRNPVETNRRIFTQNEGVLAAREEGIKRFAGSLANVGDTIDSLRKRFGDDEQVVKLETAETKMKAKLERLKSKHARARKAQAAFGAAIEKGEAIWEATLEMIAVQKLGGSAEEQAIAEFESKTAFKAINQEFNAAVADLDTESDDEGNFVFDAEVVQPRQLNEGKPISSAFDTDEVRQPAKVKVRE